MARETRPHPLEHQTARAGILIFFEYLFRSFVRYKTEIVSREGIDRAEVGTRHLTIIIVELLMLVIMVINL